MLVGARTRAVSGTGRTVLVHAHSFANYSQAWGGEGPYSAMD